MIVPAILESNVKSFQEKLKLAISLKGVKTIQIDFADGEFVATKTISVDEVKLPKTKHEFEAHLMTVAPTNLEAYKKVGFDKIILHYEAYASEHDLDEALSLINKLKMKPSLAISPRTPVSVVRYFSDTVHSFTLLGVLPGKQGQKMQSGTLDRLRELHDTVAGAEIEMDGGVNEKNIAELIDAGATLCVTGSALFDGDVKENYQNLLQALK